MDAALEVPAADEGISLEALVAAAGNSNADIDVLGEGLSVGQGKWPLDKCATSPLVSSGACVCFVLPDK